LNSKSLRNSIFIISLLTIAGCGVKAPPLQHPDTIIDSYVTEYTGASAPLPPLEIPEEDKAPEPLQISK
jgi:predicted small lipoprotein YifL